MGRRVLAEDLADPIVRQLVIDFVRRLLSAIPPGVSLTSWGRTRADNRAAGGHPESQHLRSLATDWVGDDRALAQLQAGAQAAGLHAFRGRSGHLHIQRFPAGALRSLGLL